MDNLIETLETYLQERNSYYSALSEARTDGNPSFDYSGRLSDALDDAKKKLMDAFNKCVDERIAECMKCWRKERK